MIRSACVQEGEGTPSNMTTTNTLMRHVSCFFPAQDDIYDLNVHIPGRSGWR